MSRNAERKFLKVAGIHPVSNDGNFKCHNARISSFLEGPPCQGAVVRDNDGENLTQSVPRAKSSTSSSHAPTIHLADLYRFSGSLRNKGCADVPSRRIIWRESVLLCTQTS